MRRIAGKIRDAGRLMVGLPNYRAYRQHMAEHHPAQEPMDEIAFFRNRQDARYRGGGGRCC